MLILTYESPDKTSRSIEKIEPDVLEHLLTEDRGYIEVIPMRRSSIYVRVYFDIDQYDTSNDILEDILETLCKTFGCSVDEWAIASSNRINKISYHVVSRTKCIQLKNLRNITHLLASKYKCIDTRHLYFGITDDQECGYFRLPNQSKHTIHKDAPPLRIVKGDIKDFFVTNVSELSPI